MNTTALKKEPSEQQRQRILDTFVKLVKVDGLRAVSMMSLAKTLGISTKTLYKHFSGKTELIQAVVELNDARFNENRARRILTGENAHQRILSASIEWFELRSGLGDWFWHELQRDYSSVYSLFEQRLETFLESSAAILRPQICAELNADYAMSILWKAINEVPSHEECQKFGLSRKDALTQSIDIWARGSLKMYQVDRRNGLGEDFL
jgi:AcrR family transcriptional regulator